MRLGDINSIGARALNENMEKRVGWNFGDIEKLSITQASAILESIDSKIAGFKNSKQLHESEKNSAYNGLILAKQVLESYIAEKADSPYAVGMAQAMKSTGDKPPLKKSTIKKAHKIAKAVGESSVNEISGDLAKRYTKAAKMDRDFNDDDIDRLSKSGQSTRDMHKRNSKRTKGINRAAKRMSNESRLSEAYTSQGMFEDEVGAAETIMAAQDMVDSIQGMLEDVGEMINEKLPPLTDSIRRSGGAEAAATFNQQTNSALNALMDAVRGARESMAGAVGTLSGEAPTPMGGEQDFDLDTAEPAAAPAGDDEDFDLDDFEASDAAQGGNEPLGRAKRA